MTVTLEEAMAWAKARRDETGQSWDAYHRDCGLLWDFLSDMQARKEPAAAPQPSIQDIVAAAGEATRKIL